MTDFNRPTYHYLPAKNWMNDPNGVIQWKGRYHLFYQYNPHGANHANMHWGHAVSDDMAHWEELPIAISPTPDAPDRGGIFSGCIVDDEGTPRAFYTGVNEDYSIQTQCIATGSNDLVTWETYADNPLIPAPPVEMGQTRDFRDPFVWRADDGWYMVVGSRIEGVGGAILLYRSDNLTDWIYLNPIYIGEAARTGIMFECPNFFKLDDKWVLLISSHIGHTTGTVLYFVGDFVDHKFIPQVEGVLDSGYHYASLSHEDEKGRRILWAWLREGRTVDQDIKAGWSGIQAIPRILSLDSQNRLLMTPVPEVEILRGQHHHFSAQSLTDKQLSVSGLSLDISATFAINDSADIYGMRVACSPDGKHGVTIVYDRRIETLQVQRVYAQSDAEHDDYIQGLPHHLEGDEQLELRILLDGSAIEVIANHRTSVTSRYYPAQSDHHHVQVINPTVIASLDIWEMQSIWD